MGFDHKRPRIVIVSRKSLLEVLLERHGTRSQVDFYLRARGQSLERIEHDHRRLELALREVDRSLPSSQRRTRVDRSQLDRFLFAPDDIVVIVGQDGLVPNTAKYLSGHVVFGINPDRETYDGVLCPHMTADLEPFLRAFNGSSFDPASTDRFRLEQRTMCVALREDGQRLTALNELFIGHQTHQSARYQLSWRQREERQSSSGVICATGTGATGWAASIARQRDLGPLPLPQERRLAWFVREPFPSVVTGTSLEFGILEAGQTLELRSEMGQGGLVFADGIESDWIEFLSGHKLRIGLADDCLNLVVPRQSSESDGRQDP